MNDDTGALQMDRSARRRIYRHDNTLEPGSESTLLINVCVLHAKRFCISNVLFVVFMYKSSALFALWEGLQTEARLLMNHILFSFLCIPVFLFS
jgi:hypothetical protein